METQKAITLIIAIAILFPLVGFAMWRKKKTNNQDDETSESEDERSESEEGKEGE